MTQIQIQDLKQGIQIVDYLESKGINPQRESGDELFYFSPLREENTASFVVSIRKNLFNDFGGIGGDVIRLVQLMENLTFPKALDFLKEFQGREKTPFSFTEKKDFKSIDPKTTLIDSKPIIAPSLVELIESRGIRQQTACKYLKQVHYKNEGSDKNYYGLGFQNDAGGLAIRTKKFKRAIEPVFITTIEVPESKSVVLFEGFFDFLSALEYKKILIPTNTTIILNSTGNLPKAYERLKSAENIYCFFDTDTGGRGAFKRLKAKFPNAIDYSHIYDGFKGIKDFNEFWVNQLSKIKP